MDRIIFDEIQLENAQKQLAYLAGELEDIHARLNEIRRAIMAVSKGLRSDQRWHECARLYDMAEEQLSVVRQKMLLIIRSYQRTELKNNIMVAGLPVKTVFPSGEKPVFTAKKINPNIFLELYQNKDGITVGQMLSGNGLQHEDWLIRATEGI